ncbi:MAG: TonB-dependent receptor [Bryobacterales bacterium]|nr:TonB-dependent receptor [Bryobacterales bacterium]
MPRIPFLLLLLSPLVPAQTPPIEPVKTTVVVTASKGAAELELAPAATALVTAAELEQRNTQTVDQALMQAPGMYPNRSKGFMDTDPGFGMRGFGARNFSRVLVLLDGQPINNGYSSQIAVTSLPVDELDRVEVVRGPFSALYGGNAMGGVVHMITRTPTRREIKLQGQYGSQDTTQYMLRYSDRFWERLGLSFSYQRTQTGGYSVGKVLQTATAVASPAGIIIPAPRRTLTSTGGTTYELGEQGNNWYNHHTWRTKGDVAINSRTSLAMQYMYRDYGYGYDGTRSYATDAAGAQLFRGNVFFQEAGAWRRVTLNPTSFVPGSGNGNAHFFNATLLHSFDTKGSLRIAGGQSYSPVDAFTSAAAATPANGAGGPGTYADRPNRASYAEAQYTAPRLGRHFLLAGNEMRLFSTQAYNDEVTDFAFPTNVIRRSVYSAGRSLNNGVYLQDQFSLGEKLHITGGTRLDYWRNFDGASLDRPDVPIKSYETRTARYLSAKGAAVYRLRTGSVVRFSAANAFRAPNLVDLYRTTFSAQTQVLSLPNPSLLPEQMWSVETGFRQSFSSRLQFDLSAYHNSITDLMYRVTDFTLDPTGRTSVITNVGAARTRGFEAAAEQRASSFLRLRQSYTFTNALITNNPASPATNGKRVALVPRSVATFQAFLNQKRWNVVASGRYFGKMFTNDTNTDTTKGVQGSYDPFFDSDITANVTLSTRYEAFVSVLNLLDRRYYQFNRNPGRLVTAGFRIKL